MNDGEPVQAPRTAWTNRLRAEALRMRRPEVSRIVYVGWVIASYADPDGSGAFPGNDTIAAIVGCSEETVTRAKRVLKALEVLVEKRRPNTSSLYRLQQPLGDALDWDAHLHLYTDTRQARRKKAIKEKEISEHLAARAADLAASRNPVRNGDRESRNPFPPGVPEPGAERGPGIPEPVPAGGSETLPPDSGTRSGTGAEPGAERVPEPVPAGGLQRELDKGPDKDRAEPGRRPPLSPGSGPERQVSDERAEKRGGPALASVPTPRGRTRRTTAAAPTQPPLLIALPGQAPTTPAATTDLNVPTELTVACSYCDAPAGTACRNEFGPRRAPHEARLETWAIAYSRCPDCHAHLETPCTEPDGTPMPRIHTARADGAADIRAVAREAAARHHRTGT
ncbi:helix-turn-helix domain-containing protein [Streptomyces sp. NPDC091385]|uniref:helix-turn-helix domain-containing protein n=1 Tax=Streptomyces sp. NPDC091385 TaxID=3365997 RepID=UPI00380F3835